MNAVKRRTFLRSPFGRTLALIMVGFTLIPIVTLTTISLYNVQVQLQERALTQTATVAGLIQQTVAQWTSEASGQLASTLNNAAFVQNSSFVLLSTTTNVSRAEQVLSKDLAMLASDPYFSATYLVRPDDSIALSSQPDLKGENLQIGLAQLEQQGKRIWGFDVLPLVNRQAGLIWQPILDQRQQAIGFLVGQLSIKNLSMLLLKNAVSLGQSGEIYLTDLSGIPITDLRFAVPDSQPKLTLNLTADHRYSGLFTDYANRSVVGTVQPLQQSLNSLLFVHEQQTEAFATYYQLIRVVVGLSVVLLLLAIFVAILATQWITDPLRRLSVAAGSMAAGNLSSRVEVKRRDEFGTLAISFNAMAVKLEDTFSNLANSNRSLATRADQLDTITRVGQHATSFLDLESLSPVLAREIQQAFGYYAVALYLPEQEGSALVGTAAAGTAAEEFMAMMTRREIAPTSLVGTAASTRQVINVADVTKDSRYVAHPLRPETKSEVSIPLIAGTKLIGVLDIQSDRPNAFSQEDLDILQILANQIAIAIRNADLYGDATAARQAADEANLQKSEFLSTMTHELRTPLNVIIGYSHSILNRPAMYNHVPLPTVYEQGIRSIMTSGQHLLGLINDILDLSKIEAGQIDLDLQPVDPLPILQGVRSTALGLIKPDVTLRADYPEKLPDILGDELRIRQILLNLVSNAAKFTEHGFITLDARVETQKLLFSVRDTAMGIADDAQSYVFDRFRQAGRDVAKKHGGSGLGLSISRQLCEMHGGTIWFDSQVGKGTTFYFTIPLAQDIDRETRPLLPQGWAEEISTRAQIFTPVENLLQQALLVDTRLESRNKLRAALVQAKYDVLIADEAERGMEMAEAVLPNVLVINVHPDDAQAIVGLAARCKQHSDLSKIPIVVLNDVQSPTNSFVADQLLILHLTQ